MRILVLGAGMQGSACAYDLLGHPAVERVTLVDRQIGALPAFLQPYADAKLRTQAADARDTVAMASLISECDAVACALPYYFNFEIARLAVAAGRHFCDLGGNTAIVHRQKGLDAEARAKGVSVIPDCGLAPGMVNIFAMGAMNALESVRGVKMYVGGLPQHPEPPLDYQIVYSVEGMLDYYTTPSRVLRESEMREVEPLSEVELQRFHIRFPGKGEGGERDVELEAFHTAGGLSTMGERFAGKIGFMEYKTLRYPGHAAIMRAIRGLGLLSNEPLKVGSQEVVPRELFIAAAEPHLRKPEGRDMVILRVTAFGSLQGRSTHVSFNVTDFRDESTGLSAMMRTTGFSLAITSLMQLGAEVASAGVLTPDEGVDPDLFSRELEKRSIHVERSVVFDA